MSFGWVTFKAVNFGLRITLFQFHLTYIQNNRLSVQLFINLTPLWLNRVTPSHI